MFSTATIYRISSDLSVYNDVVDAMENFAFVPCGSTQQKSIGWIPPRGQANGPLVEHVAGQRIMKLMIESKAVPSDVLDREVERRCLTIEKTDGFKPGKKQRREIKEDALLSLLPMAFPKRTAVLVWIDAANKRLVLDSASKSRCDDAVTLLIKSLDGLALQMLNTQTSPSAAMAMWLTDQETVPTNFTVDRECELKACDESKAVVKYGHHPLDIAEVAQHIQQGKIPRKLALTWADRVSFVLTDVMTLKKIDLLDAAVTGGNDPDADAFDGDVALSTGQLGPAINDLIKALGGEPQFD